MKINWFSPLPPAKTGIADYTLFLLPILSKYAEIVVWTDRDSWNSEIEKYAKVRYYQLPITSWLEINQSELNIYHIGNNPDFHSSIWKISLQCPGLVILHDLNLHHFFDDIYRNQEHNYDGYIEKMYRYYGLKGKKDAENFWNSLLPIEYMSEHYPLTYLAIENSVGVITHNPNAFFGLKRDKRWFLGYSPLPYPSKSLMTKRNNIKFTPPYKLIVFGYIHTNRRLDSFLEALSTFPEKDCFHLDIYGQIWDLNYIKQKIQTLGLNKLVSLQGFVKESELESALANAHLAINMRYPTMGEASISQLRIWSHALPSLVTKVGWYASLPENTVAFVRYEDEIADIQHHLRNFFNQPEQFREMGIRGQQILQDLHNPESYVKAIVDFSNMVCRFRSSAVAYKLVERVGSIISDWTDYKLSEKEIERVAESIHFLTYKPLDAQNNS